MARKPAIFTEDATFATRLRELLNGPPKVTQQTLADAIGVKRQTVALYASGQTKPNATQIAMIARFFKITSDWLLGLSDSKTLENESAGAEFGLSDVAADRLGYYAELANCEKNPRIGGMPYARKKLKVINALIESAPGWCFLEVLSNYLRVPKRENMTQPNRKLFLLRNGEMINGFTLESLETYVHEHPGTLLCDAYGLEAFDERTVVLKAMEERMIEKLRELYQLVELNEPCKNVTEDMNEMVRITTEMHELWKNDWD